MWAFLNTQGCFVLIHAHDSCGSWLLTMVAPGSSCSHIASKSLLTCDLCAARRALSVRVDAEAELDEEDILAHGLEALSETWMLMEFCDRCAAVCCR